MVTFEQRYKLSIKKKIAGGRNSRRNDPKVGGIL